MNTRPDMADIADVGRDRLVLPTGAAKEKEHAGSKAAACRKKSSTRASRSGNRLARNPRSDAMILRGCTG